MRPPDPRGRRRQTCFDQETQPPWLGHWWYLWQQRTHPYLTSVCLHPWRHKPWSGSLAASAHSLKKVACQLGPDRASQLSIRSLNLKKKKKKILQGSSLGRIASSPNLIISLKCSCQHRDPASMNLQACLLRCHLRTIDNWGNWNLFLQGLVKLIIPGTCLYFLKCFILPTVSLHFLNLKHLKEESYKRKLQDLAVETLLLFQSKLHNWPHDKCS